MARPVVRDLHTTGPARAMVAISVPSRLQPSVCIPVDERIMQLRLKDSLGFMSVVAVYAPTKVCETEEEMFYSKLNSVLDQCPCHDALIVLGDFNAVTGTETAGYEICVGPHGSGTRNDNSSFLLNFARSRRLRIAGSWYQRPALHHWTSYSNAGGLAKRSTISLLVLVGGSSRTAGFFWSAEFFVTDHRLLVASLKLHVKSRKPLNCNHTVFHLEKLKDLTCAQEYAVTVFNWFGVLDKLEDSGEL